jgi:pectate lyase
VVGFLTGGDPEPPSAVPNIAGYGASSLGGYGGTTVRVTNLNDSGAGSLRAALALTYPRIIRFDVAGTIELQSRLGIEPTMGRVTIEGQTAPAGGICLKGYGMEIGGDDVIVQHLRIRPGTNATPESNDGLYVHSNRVVIDHCSISWSQDELINIYGQDVTIQWCILSEALSNSGHPNGEHSKGPFWVWTADRISFHHNLMAHNLDRNPYAAHGHADIINNILYNKVDFGNVCAVAPQDGATSNDVSVNFVKNWQRVNDTDASIRFFQNEFTGLMTGYVEGNISERRPNNTYPENECVYEEEHGYLLASRIPFTGSYPVTETDAETAKTQVLAGAGATKPKRDGVDARIVADVTNNTGGFIDFPTDVGGWPDLTV